MSGMVIGSMMEADHSLRKYEAQVRIQRRLAKERAKWKSFEDQYGKAEDDE